MGWGLGLVGEGSPLSPDDADEGGVFDHLTFRVVEHDCVKSFLNLSSDQPEDYSHWDAK